MTSSTSRSSATTWSATGRKSPPIARPARRWRRSPSRARSTISRASSAWIPIDLRLINAVRGRHEDGLRRHRALHRVRRNARSRSRRSAHYKAPLASRAGARRRRWLLVQHRRRILCRRPRRRRRRRHGRLLQSRHWRLARLHGDDGGRNAGPADRARALHDRRHHLHRLQRLDRRQPRDVRHRHGRRRSRAESRRRPQAPRRRRHGSAISPWSNGGWRRHLPRSGEGREAAHA